MTLREKFSFQFLFQGQILKDRDQVQNSGSIIYNIPLTFETARVLAALAQANHIVHLCSGPSRVFRRRASSSVLGIVIVL